ncbi:hypothetical protein GCM10027280_26500 [Micromonospora polyrhachis]|uniref:Ser/Thr protein kinase RdoA (MazF antagonist) n=1 Tax=Micromonospora polyrhachis TaxID=1282883 RepID=A0A7W7SMZ1_9ACTN|nr:aminoglycoside phosphotransferase family protein [Micromonospora polyrhachis]MBB4957745.1 Ser/Thr protein kinase RdoA (MazF antagonist) [Micromonospora polyrhachis]
MTSRPALLHAARRLLGAFTVATWHDGHNNTMLLRAHTDGGDVIVKIHRDRQRHDREVHAYRAWVPALGDRAPQLIAVNDELLAIAITSMPGRPVAELTLSQADEQNTFAQAGAILRDLHAAAPTVYNPRFCQYLAERGTYWLQRVPTPIDPTHLAELSHKLDTLAQLDLAILTPCHLDFMPRNLIRDEQGTVRVIDFEHARHDLPTRDLVRMATRIWHDRPDLRQAFTGTYGLLTELDEIVIDSCAVIDAASLAATSAATGVAPVHHRYSATGSTPLSQGIPRQTGR